MTELRMLVNDYFIAPFFDATNRLYNRVSVRRSVGPSVTSYFFGLLGVTNAVITALFQVSMVVSNGRAIFSLNSALLGTPHEALWGPHKACLSPYGCLRSPEANMKSWGCLRSFLGFLRLPEGSGRGGSVGPTLLSGSIFRHPTQCAMSIILCW